MRRRTLELVSASEAIGTTDGDRGDGHAAEAAAADHRALRARAGGTGSREYLSRETPDGDPAIQHAYALTTYAAQGKTFDQAFVLLDAGISREDFVVAISRARGETVAYGVAATELTDEHLGPGRREIVDPLHDLRHGAERVASEYPAVARLGLRLVEERMVQLRRMQVGEAKRSATGPILDALGPSPDDQSLRRRWDEGADLICGYRLRHGITSPDGDPLGPRSGDASRRRERQEVQQRLERIQDRLGQERTRSAERVLEIEV